MINISYNDKADNTNLTDRIETLNTAAKYTYNKNQYFYETSTQKVYRALTSISQGTTITTSNSGPTNVYKELDILDTTLYPQIITDTLTQTGAIDIVRIYTFNSNAVNNPVTGFGGVIIAMPSSNGEYVEKLLISESGRLFTCIYRSGVSYGSWLEK